MTEHNHKLFDDGKTYKFRHLQNAGLVRDRNDLEGKKEFGFPPGRLLTPRDRQWTGKELNDYLATRPVTQAEFDALADRPPKTMPVIPPRKKQPPLNIARDLKSLAPSSDWKRRRGRARKAEAAQHI